MIKFGVLNATIPTCGCISDIDGLINQLNPDQGDVQQSTVIHKDIMVTRNQ